MKHGFRVCTTRGKNEIPPSDNESLARLTRKEKKDTIPAAVDLLRWDRYYSAPSCLSLKRGRDSGLGRARSSVTVVRNREKLWCLCVIGILVSLAGCATGHYTPLAEAEKDQIEQLQESVYRVEYGVSSFTSQEQLDAYLRRRCAELTFREGYDYFHLGQRYDVLALSRRTSMTVTMFKGMKPAGAIDFYDAKTVLNEQP
jgi:hypothetical protein